MLPSERVVIESPTSFTGSAKRLWKMTRTENPWLRAGLLIPLAVICIAMAWAMIFGWYACVGVLVAPWRIMRRGSRQRKRQALQHREIMQAIQSGRPSYLPPSR